MEQDKVRAFVPKFLNEEGDDLQCLLRDIIYWWFYLLPEVRARTALPNSLCSFDISRFID